MSQRILESLVIVAEMTGSSLSEPAIKGMVLELSAYPEDQVLNALARCRRELKHRITLADIMERLIASDGRPSADEAWGRAILAFDEQATVILNDDISQAMVAARPMYQDRDKVGARMAFKSAYDRLVQDARGWGTPLKWWPSLGQDPYGRETAIKEGVRLGLLPPGSDAKLLPPSDNQEFSQIIVGMLGYDKDERTMSPEEARKKLKELRDQLSRPKSS